MRSHITAQVFLELSSKYFGSVEILNKGVVEFVPENKPYYVWSVMKDIHQHRPLLFSVAYDILGDVQEAEDIVQDVFESWIAKRPEVQFPKAYLSRAVVNKSIDRLEVLKKAREFYKGPWLPVPIVSESF